MKMMTKNGDRKKTKHFEKHTRKDSGEGCGSRSDLNTMRKPHNLQINWTKRDEA